MSAGYLTVHWARLWLSMLVVCYIWFRYKYMHCNFRVFGPCKLYKIIEIDKNICNKTFIAWLSINWNQKWYTSSLYNNTFHLLLSVSTQTLNGRNWFLSVRFVTFSLKYNLMFSMHLLCCFPNCFLKI